MEPVCSFGMSRAIGSSEWGVGRSSTGAITRATVVDSRSVSGTRVCAFQGDQAHRGVLVVDDGKGGRVAVAIGRVGEELLTVVVFGTVTGSGVTASLTGNPPSSSRSFAWPPSAAATAVTNQPTTTSHGAGRPPRSR